MLTSRFTSGSQQTESNRSPHPQRPINGQNTQASHSKPTTNFNRSTNLRPPQAQPSTQDNSAGYRTDNQRQEFQTASVENYHVTQNRSPSIEQSPNSRPRQHNPPPSLPRKFQRQEDLPPTKDNQNINHSADRSRKTEISNQTTVNPSQIFNHYEYQKRQATAEAARKATEEAAAKKMEATKPAHVAAPPQSPPATAPAPAPAPSSASAETDSAASKKGQMELEMMQMIEKMRDYKAKDPALFTQFWDQV